MEGEKYKIYRCPNGCCVTDYHGRCGKCNEWTLFAGEKTMEEIEKFNEELTRSAI